MQKGIYLGNLPNPPKRDKEYAKKSRTHFKNTEIAIPINIGNTKGRALSSFLIVNLINNYSSGTNSIISET